MSLDAIPLSRTRLKTHPRLFTSAELAVIRTVVQHHGAPDIPKLPRRDGIDASDRVPLSAVVEALHHARCVLGDAMAPRIGMALHLSTFGVPGFLLMSCATLMDALEGARRIWPLLNLRYDLDFSVRGDRVRVTLKDRFGLDEQSDGLFALLEVIRLVTFCRDLAGQHFQPIQIGWGHRSLQDCALLSGSIGAEVAPADATFIDIDAFQMHAALPQANASTQRHISAMCDRMIDEIFGEPFLVRRVKGLMASLDRGVPPLSEIANALCMSERTLRRRLHDIGTSYYRLLDEVRMEMAEGFLRDDDVTTDRIAERLGYAEVANFCHAFRRWTGSSPSRFRLQLQG